MEQKIDVKLTRYELWLIKEALQFSYEYDREYDEESDHVFQSQMQLHEELDMVK